MNTYPETRDSLILRIKDPANREAWEQFAQIYEPVIFRTALAKGLQHADAQDIVQQVLLSVAQAIGRWEKSDNNTRFRQWLSKVIRHAIINAVTRRPTDLAVGGPSERNDWDEIAISDPAIELLIAKEYRRELYLRAVDEVRPTVSPDTWEAFELTVTRGVGMDQAARQLGKSVGAIYSCRSRVMMRLRDVVKDLEALEQ